MGLFGMFKKKEEAPVNNPNSVFTLRFVVPFFQIFDKTNPALSALPISISVSGSCQYRISEPDLCFDNIPLGKMSPAQLEAHVIDALKLNIKSYFNAIKDIPLLQFEQRIALISEGCRERLSKLMAEEYGINLRTFNISAVNYDKSELNYLKLEQMSHDALSHMRTSQSNEARRREAEKDVQAKIGLDSMKRHAELRDKQDRLEHAASTIDTELELARKRAEFDREQSLAEKAGKQMDFDLTERSKRLDTELYVQRSAADAQAKFISKHGDVAPSFDTDFSTSADNSGFDTSTSGL